MELALIPDEGFIEFCMALLFLLACGQMVHLVVIRRARGKGFWRLTMAYEIMVAIHLTVGALLVNSVGHAWIPSFIAIGSLLIPLDIFLWLNVAFFACGLVLCIGARKPQVIPELIALLAMTPMVLDIAVPAFAIPVILDVVVFGFAITQRLLLDYAHSFATVVPSAVVSAMKAMPEGVLLASPDGRVLFVNDAMRGLLAQFDVRADLSRLSDILGTVRGRAGAHEGDRSMRLPVCDEAGSPVQIWHVTTDEARLGAQRCMRVLAIDITEESALEHKLVQAGEQLEKTEAQLVETLDEVREAAVDEALICMRSRVHDVIGQRLSLLHRYLEDESIDDESLEKMKPMLKGIVEDLHEDADVDWRIELDSTVSAFSLVGVDVRIEGDLPQDLDVAIACTGIIREAVTNAVKHANASEVSVRFGGEESKLRMTIEDNGASASKAHISEGQGIKGMRTVVARCEGELEIAQSPSFTIVATFPTMCDTNP